MTTNDPNGWRQILIGAVALILLLGSLAYLYTEDETPALPTESTEAFGNAEPIRGLAQVHDGDSIIINGLKIRLWGIDAPELEQTCIHNDAIVPCGHMARDAALNLISQRIVTCMRKDISYDRIVAQCTVGEEDIARALVLSGMAISEWYHSKAPYKDEEKSARKENAGIWAMDFQKPRDWRLCNMSKYESSRPADCP